jgi:hypothetical protein
MAQGAEKMNRWLKKHHIGKHYLPGKRIDRSLVVFVILLILISFTISSCQIAIPGKKPSSTVITPSTSASDSTNKPNYLNSYALTQKVAEAINNPEQAVSLFQSIPDRQRPELPLDDFVQYISLLRRGVNGSVTALTRMNTSELNALFSSLKYNSKLKNEGFYLHFKQSGKQPETMAFFLQLTEEGMPYLDQLPIAKALAMQNYAALYFDAIDRFDRDSLSVLIKSRSETRSPRLLKADRILAFYRNQVTTASTAFRVSLLMPDRIIFDQQVYEDTNKTLTGNRTITVLADGAAGFVIVDPIADQLDPVDLRIKSKGQNIFDLGTLVKGLIPQVTSSQVESIIGNAILHDDTTCTVIDKNSRAMTSYYNGLVIEGIGRCDQHRFWQVSMKAVTLTTPDFSIGSGLAVGASLDALLMRYPFIDDNDWQVEGTVGNYRMIVRFEISNQVINRIKITVFGG